LRYLDADGLYLFPGFVDMHAHWRTPGREDEETIESGSAAAAAGGFASVVMMPNTDPVVDKPVVVSGLVRRAERESRVRTYVSAALHEGLKGERLTEMRLLKEAGAFCVSDDGLGTQSAGVLRNCMVYAKSAGLPVILHCEDRTLSTGVVHDGVTAALAGVPGSPGSAEDVATAAALVLAAETGAKVHITHVSTALSAALVGFFKKISGADVTADTTPHHLTLTDERIETLDGLYRVNPPLRPDGDRVGVGEALASGTLDFVATDHAPHTQSEKELPLEEAAPGFSGHETAFAALYTELVQGGELSLSRLVEAMACAPGRWVGGDGAYGISPGAPGDLTLVDLSEEWTVQADSLISRSSNSPYLGRRLKGRVVGTVVGGELVYDRIGAKFGV
jgi:dihydroorotase